MPNRIDQAARMMQRKQDRLDAGILSDRFPNISNIVVHMKYFRQGVNPLLMVRTVNFLPSGHACFNMECMIRGCLNGGFDFTRIIAGMIKDNKKLKKGKLTCEGKSKEVSPGHSNIEYEISITYCKKKLK